MKIYHRKGKKSMNPVKFEKQSNGLYKLYIGKKCKGTNLTIDEVLTIISKDEEKCLDYISGN